MHEPERNPPKEVSLQPTATELLWSSAPITIAIEAAADPIPLTRLLSTERHLAVQLDARAVERLSEISNTLAGSTASLDELSSVGDETGKILVAAQPRLVGLFSAVRKSKHPQPIAWAGKASLLTEVYRPILAARFDAGLGLTALLSVECGSHFFTPLFEEDNPHRIPQRADGPLQVGRIARLPSAGAGDGAPSKQLDELRKEVLVVEGLNERDGMQQVLELSAQANSRTRAIVQLGNDSPTPELLQIIFTSVPFVSHLDGRLSGAGLAGNLEGFLRARAHMQALPCVMAAARALWLERFATEERLQDYRAALRWSNWSWIGRPLFASDFGAEVPAAYPHLMDLRSVASKDWYYNRTQGIPEKYTADELARSDTEPKDRFHFYVTGAGGTGKSCFI